MMQQHRLASLLPRMVALRRAIHAYPELAFEEAETASRIIAELKKLDIPYRYHGVGSGVVGILGPHHGPRIALRAEMDALPGTETTGLEFASSIPGIMHACGHDAHVAMVLGAAAMLKRSPPPGTVVLLFQPAEEKGSGARTVIRSGALEGVRAIFAGHVTHHYVTGGIMVAEGVITAQSDRFRIEIKGRGGHGARPHEATDAVVIAGFLVTAIQTLVSREINPLHPSVVTIGHVEAGTAANVIAEQAILEGSIRTTEAATRAKLHRGLKRMVEAIGTLHDAEVDLQLTPGNPPVVNTARETGIARRAAEQVASVIAEPGMEHPSMGSEDFSLYLDECPGCYVRFGARRPDWEPVPLHSPAFTVDEDVLMVGADFFERVAREALGEFASH